MGRWATFTTINPSPSQLKTIREIAGSQMFWNITHILCSRVGEYVKLMNLSTFRVVNFQHRKPQGYRTTHGAMLQMTMEYGVHDHRLCWNERWQIFSKENFPQEAVFAHCWFFQFLYKGSLLRYSLHGVIFKLYTKIKDLQDKHKQSVGSGPL